MGIRELDKMMKEKQQRHKESVKKSSGNKQGEKQ
jgi:hypothetical protein